MAKLKSTDDEAVRDHEELANSLRLPPVKDESESDDEANDEINSSSNGKGMEEVWIAVMGVTGAGKSSFIQLCTGKPPEELKIGHGLESCTTVVQEYSFICKDKGDNASILVHLIDTPGFDDTNKNDAEVLRDIANWLNTTYQNKILLSGVLYLHRISDPKMQGSARRNLLMFMQLCGPHCYQNVMLVTTMWSIVSNRTGEERERELVEKFWGTMKKQGSLVRRHEGNKTSALSILGDLIDRREKIILQIQQEMVENKKDLNETAAGQQLDQDLLREKAKHKKEMRELKQQMDQAIKSHDEVAKAYIADMQKDLQGKIEEGERARESIRRDFEKLQKEREEEMNKMKNRINDQVKQLEESSKRHSELQAKLDAGQGSPMLNKQMKDYEQKIHSLEMKIETQTKMMERRKGGVSAEVGEWSKRLKYLFMTTAD
ncbi:uncharacterized protein Z519_03359 [Cladophialophora bantiana CBS 173.52]|uniref:G domain-containing protein n=1 Tax=Cladophialophora bantiana (strain ATCC 10958 / CBS 173.52 / CDC B-1940 / NIH 8579) TaxID=1442370 RepID=A0A0D2HZE3_CLAB1|nr:uncharacterized protein Z519_03359 [Cladophialophora bantiana CBS 173.52]KIW96290.1 hypothetical protein Z519_03359 [Cladophialophora bantiana CBS 173.52]